MWKLTDKEFGSLLEAPPERRYRYFLNHAADEERIWTLADDRGERLAFVATGEQRCIPLWPHKRYAQHDLASGRWHDVSPIGIHVDDVFDAVIPGATEDGMLFAVFPVDERAFVVAPGELERDLRAELATY